MSFEDAYKTITNSLGKFDPVEFVVFAAGKLRRVESQGILYSNGNFPWNYLRLLKLVWLYGGKSSPLKRIDDKRLNNLMRRLFDLDEEGPHPLLAESQSHGVLKYFRSLVNQQFWFQYDLGKWNIARQFLILQDLSEDHPIRKTLREAYSIEPLRLLELLFVLWAWVRESADNLIFDNRLFALLNYSEEEIAAFLRVFSLSRDTALGYLNQNKLVKNSLSEAYEMSPFVKKPLFEMPNGSYLVYSCKVLEQCIKTFIFYGVNDVGGSSLKERFGEQFENYVGELLLQTDLQFVPEDKLKTIYPDSKITDYLIQSDEFSVLVEVKSKNIKESVRVFSAEEQLVRELKDNVIKAAIQAFELAHTLEARLQKVDDLANTNYLIILTFVPFNLGDGETIYAEFLADAINPILQEKQIDTSLIRPENIYVLDIEEMERLVSFLLSGISLRSILDTVAQNNKHPETRSLLFSQHLDKYGDTSRKIEMLETGFEEFVESVRLRFKT